MRLKNILVLLSILIALAGIYYGLGQPAPPPASMGQEYVWLIEMDDIMRVEMRLPRENASQRFVKVPEGDKFPWFFDDANRTPVDQVRWSGGIPLLLSGPGAERKIVEDATPAEFERFGLTNPQLEIVLTLKDQRTLSIAVGDRTPDQRRIYVRAPNTNAVATVDGSWLDVMAGLVRRPPYSPAR